MKFERPALRIRLPEGVSFAVPLGGPAARFASFTMDVFVVLALATIIERLTASVRALQADLGAGVLVIGYFAIWPLYGTFCEYYWQGQTIGKWLLGLRVVDASGPELQFHQVAIRNLVRPVDLLPAVGLMGGVCMLASRRLQRLGDLAAGTVVIRTDRPEQPNVDALTRGRYNSFLVHQVLCARLRQRVAPKIASIAIDALMRRDTLDDRPRVVVFDELAGYFGKLVEFPPEQTEQLTSEQYVRNVVEILCSSKGR